MLNKISGASFFDPLPKKRILLGKNFLPLDKSLIWDLNSFFWQNTKLWEKTYGQHYEKSLPTGVSSSHEPEFVKKSADHFFNFLIKLQDDNRLPKKIIVLEQGPGSGLYAKQFLDYLKFHSTQKYDFYNNLLYVLADSSKELLSETQDLLTNHKKHLDVYCQKSNLDLPLKYQGQVLFARHGNFWDQLPCRLIKIRNGKLFEVYVRAIIDKKENYIWKSFVESLKLETKEVPLKNEEKFPFWKYLKPLLKNAGDISEVIVSTEVLNNVSAFIKLVDCNGGGYMEVVDLIVPNMDGFLKDRRPKKYDGALAVPINGPLLKAFLNQNNKHLSLAPIRGINSVCRIVSSNLETLFQHEHFVKIAEIAPKLEQNTKEIVEKANKLFSAGADVIAFSDQAHAGNEYYPIIQIAKQKIFSKLPGGAVLPILAARRKTLSEIKIFCQDLKEQKINNLFVLVGDPNPGETTASLSWKEVLPLVSEKFLTGAVAHPNPNDLENSLQKIALGARFLIVQACYDADIWQNWIREVKANKLHEKVKLVPVIIPIITKKGLEVLKLLPDVAVSKDFIEIFQNLDDLNFHQKGVELARSMITEYKNEGIFSGVYLYSKSSEVIKEVFST